MTTREMQKGLSYCLISAGVLIFLRSDGQQAIGEKWQPVPPPERVVSTFDETRGNWYYKREYYRKARQLYDALRKKVDDIDQLKMSFFNKRAESDQSVADFNLKLGFGEGEVDEALKNLTEQLAQERETMIQLTEDERKIEQELREKRNTLEQLKTDLSTVGQLDHTLDKSVGLVLENISQARSYEEKAWKDYTAIGQTLSDRKAEQLYLDMQVAMKNVENISTYLTQKLSSFFHAKTEELTSLMQKVRDSLEKLRASGIELSKKVAADIKADIERKQAELARKIQEEQARIEAEKKAQASKSWWQLLKESMTSLTKSVREKIFGSPPKKIAEGPPSKPGKSFAKKL